MKATGLVFKSRDYIGSAEPPATVLEDESRYGNDGAFLGDGQPDWVRLSSGLWVMSFDGANDRVAIPAGPSTNMTDTITVEAWVKYVSGTYYMSKKQSGASIGWTMSDGTWGILGGGVAGWHWCPHTNIDDATWHHAVATYDKALGSGNMKFFIDGEFDAEADYAGGMPAYEEEINIGANYVPDTYCQCYISRVRIYNPALNPAQIGARYQAGRSWFGV